jgi:hypothetical protein
MKKKQTRKPKARAAQAGPRPKIKPRGGYRGARDNEGLTPRQRLDALKADLASLDLAKQRGELVSLAEVEAGHAEMREVVRSDLLGVLPLKLGALLAGKSMEAREVREVVLGAVRDVLQSWAAGGVPVPESDR